MPAIFRFILIFSFCAARGLAAAEASGPVIAGGDYPPGSTAVIHFLSTQPIRNLVARGFAQRARFWEASGSGDSWALLAVPLGAKPGRHIVRVGWAKGSQSFRRNLYINVKKPVFPKSVVHLGASKQRLFSPLKKENRLIRRNSRGASGTEPLWQGLFNLPVEAGVSSPFGIYRAYDAGGRGWYHKGVDLAAPWGSPIRAPNAGQVKLARKLKAYGGTVVIDHGDGLFTYYFHMSRLKVSAGDEVGKGQVIGLVGSEGISTGPHLHWQMMLNGQAVDPFQWVAAGARLWLAKKNRADKADSLEGAGGGFN